MGTNHGELVKGADGSFYIVIGKPGEYELFRCATQHVGSFKRKWEAVAAVEGSTREPAPPAWVESY